MLFAGSRYGTISQKSRRLYRAIKGPPRDTFLDLMVGTCPELSAVIVTNDHGSGATSPPQCFL